MKTFVVIELTEQNLRNRKRGRASDDPDERVEFNMPSEIASKLMILAVQGRLADVIATA